MPTTRDLLTTTSGQAAEELRRLVRDHPEPVGLDLLRIAGDLHEQGLPRILALQRLARWEGDFSGVRLREGLDEFVRGVEREFPSHRLDEIGAEARRCPWLTEMWILIFIADAMVRLGHPAGLPWAKGVKKALRGSIAEESLTLLFRGYEGDGETGCSPSEPKP